MFSVNVQCEHYEGNKKHESYYIVIIKNNTDNTISSCCNYCKHKPICTYETTARKATISTRKWTKHSVEKQTIWTRRGTANKWENITVSKISYNSVEHMTCNYSMMLSADIGDIFKLRHHSHVRF